MEHKDKVNILLVDDQPAKLISYEVVLRELDENLIKTASATEALQALLKNEIAVVLVDVCMPDLDGFELAAMIREHPRFQRTAIIFISAVLLTDADYVRGYEMGGVDYVPVPVVPELLARQSAGVRRALSQDARAREAQSRAGASRRGAHRRGRSVGRSGLRESERSRSVALAAGQMGSWEWDVRPANAVWDAGQYRVFGLEPDQFKPSYENIKAVVHEDDLPRIKALTDIGEKPTFQIELRVIRPKRRAAPLHLRRRPDARRRRQGDAGERRHDRHYRTQAGGRAARRCWRAKSITAPAMRSPSCRPSSVSHTPIRRKVMWQPSRGASMPSRRRIRCCRKHAGKAPDIERLVERGDGAISRCRRLARGDRRAAGFSVARESAKSRSRASRIGDEFGQIRRAVGSQRGSQGLAKRTPMG